MPDGTVSFTNGVTLTVGDACGDVTDAVLRRLQIREAIQAHFEKESQLFGKGIKVLTLFFIDEVAKYRVYDGSQEKQGQCVVTFEEEYRAHLNEVLTLEPSEYNDHLKVIEPGRTHKGYFSIDKKSKRLVDPDVGARSAERTSDDVDADELILRRKGQLLSFEEPVQFIFAHSALREGWDNPNAFVIGMLKKAAPENVTSRRQEVGPRVATLRESAGRSDGRSRDGARPERADRGSSGGLQGICGRSPEGNRRGYFGQTEES